MTLTRNPGGCMDPCTPVCTRPIPSEDPGYRMLGFASYLSFYVYRLSSGVLVCRRVHVCMSACISQKPHDPTSVEFYLHVAYRHGSAFLYLMALRYVTVYDSNFPRVVFTEFRPNPGIGPAIVLCFYQRTLYL